MPAAADIRAAVAGVWIDDPDAAEDATRRIREAFAAREMPAETTQAIARRTRDWPTGMGRGRRGGCGAPVGDRRGPFRMRRAIRRCRPARRTGPQGVTSNSSERHDLVVETSR